MNRGTSPTGYRQILCPVDFSRHSRAALRYASALAERSDGQLTVLFANDPMLAAGVAAATRDAYRLDAETVTELRRFVYSTLGPVGAKAALKVVIGHPVDQIDRIARFLNVDLIVMGTHGLSGPKKWFFGSTTEAVFRRAKVPVLAVPARGRAYDQKRRSGENTILAPVDLEGADRAELRQVTDAAQRLGGNALVFYVVKPAQVPPWLAGRAGDIERDRVQRAEKEMRRLVGGSTRVQTRVVVGDPVHQIEKAAAEEKAAVIVMTLKRYGPLGPRRGSTAYRVVCSNVAAVLALPAPES